MKFLTIFYAQCSFFEHQVSSWYWVKRRKSADVIITYPICTTKQSLVHLHIEEVKQLKLQLKVENFLIKKQKFFFLKRWDLKKLFAFQLFLSYHDLTSWSTMCRNLAFLARKFNFFSKEKFYLKTNLNFSAKMRPFLSTV